MEFDKNDKTGGGIHALTETNAAAALCVWNAKALDRQVGNNAALQARLLAKFLAGSKLKVADLVNAAATDQPSKVAEIAHQLKASARSVGAMQLGESCQLAEAAGSAGKVDDCKALASVIEERFATVSQVIQESLV